MTGADSHHFCLLTFEKPKKKKRKKKELDQFISFIALERCNSAVCTVSGNKRYIECGEWVLLLVTI